MVRTNLYKNEDRKGKTNRRWTPAEFFLLLSLICNRNHTPMVLIARVALSMTKWHSCQWRVRKQTFPQDVPSSRGRQLKFRYGKPRVYRTNSGYGGTFVKPKVPVTAGKPAQLSPRKASFGNRANQIIRWLKSQSSPRNSSTLVCSAEASSYRHLLINTASCSTISHIVECQEWSPSNKEKAPHRFPKIQWNPHHSQIKEPSRSIDSGEGEKWGHKSWVMLKAEGKN